MYKRRYDKSWNFKEDSMNELNHLIHPYPAMMMPLIARRVLEKYGNGFDTSILDPYMGSGTTIVEAIRYGAKEVYGFDLNPLAILISKSKSTKFDINKLESDIKRFNSHVELFDSSATITDVSTDFSIRDSWFREKNSIELDYIKDFINTLDGASKLFFNVSFSHTVRRVSFTRNGEFKLYRIPENKRASHNPNSFSEMSTILLNNLSLVKNSQNHLNYATEVNIFLENSIDIIKRDEYQNRFNLVVTSPPYGDSRTTVAYGQFSRLANEWLGIENAQQIDNDLLGGRNNVDINKIFNIRELDTVINEIKERDKDFTSTRSKDVIAFYTDYLESIKSVAATIKNGGHVIYVVGNRRVRDVEIPMDIITAKAFETYGFKHIETIVRDILNKRMPSKASPENEAGYQVSTMMNEYIVIMKKVG